MDEKKKKKLERPVLADGEATGHAHVLDDPKAEVYEREGGVREFAAPKRLTVVHEEHKPVTLPARKGKPGYIADRVVETDPFGNERRVTD